MKLYWTPRSCAMGIAVLLEDVEAKAWEMMDYAIDTLQGQGFLRLFFPSRFGGPEGVRLWRTAW